MSGIIGLAVLALLIQNRTRIAAWRATRRAARATARATAPAAAAAGNVTTAKAKGGGFKKVIETGIALAKLTSLLAITGVLFVFIVGPTKFWGQPIVVQVPAQGATGGITTQAGATYDPKRIDVVAPVGTLATPLEKWSAPLNLYGRRSHMDALSDDGMRREGVLAVYADGIIHIIGPGLNPDIGKPNTLRFLSLTNFPLRISGTIE